MNAPTPQGILVNVEAELAYWRQILPTTEFGQASLPFEHFEPTIKFGYDCYLLYPKISLAEALPNFRERYRSRMPVDQQLDWRWADQIIRHTWGRVKAQ